jgi:hypothetical protein
LFARQRNIAVADIVNVADRGIVCLAPFCALR